MWTALDDPAASWLPVGTWTCLGAHLFARARWPYCLSIGAAAAVLTRLVHSTTDA